ncbi:beta-ketoacyl-[acyl-carrier-protein] synthase family protein [Psychromarinibacter sp. C21-152]|uniref:Nodulation protein E n=1 Tax=Psychromarinibacter sediminicola TaxID=3033385 RepID=A0AAE3NTX5_9RHOB|nr:beta-ketoacyl-[acyl-carrier-protein] synthase family protein [Psychromarinibacter sediminicola]MDF0601589.1 beta-ketoacyl-[acyl-carrier-protein] synthase family protein [Psychromarinibacter sediminicola]
MTPPRIVITGAGAFSPCGAGVDALWSSARDGVSAAREIDFDTIPDQKVKIAASIDAAMLAPYADRLKPRMQDRVAGFALIAADEAITQAGLTEADFGEDCGVIVGSGFGGAETLDANYLKFFTQHYGGSPQRLDAMAIPKIMTNAAASWISMTWGARGPAYCISTACSSASQSIGLAYQLIRAGAMERCITGGSEACVVAGVFRAWEMLRVLSPDACRPFSRDRNGMMLGEGAGILILETLEAAEARGAEPLAEIVGYGTTTDAGDLLRPDPDGAAGAMTRAMADAGLRADEVGYVNAHGTATVANDLSETQAMRRVFGNRFDEVAVSSTKPIHGHALGAAGALETIITLQALRNRLAPPSGNFGELDPAIGFEPVHGAARAFDAPAAMCNSFAFGGINASLILGSAARL